MHRHPLGKPAAEVVNLQILPQIFLGEGVGVIANQIDPRAVVHRKIGHRRSLAPAGLPDFHRLAVDAPLIRHAKHQVAALHLGYQGVPAGGRRNPDDVVELAGG